MRVAAKTSNWTSKDRLVKLKLLYERIDTNNRAQQVFESRWANFIMKALCFPTSETALGCEIC